MKLSKSEKDPAEKKWTPPLNVKSYNRDSALTRSEVRALKNHAHEHHPAREELHTKVQRLITPIDDLFERTRLRRCLRPFVILYLLREMTRRGRSFWGWTTQEWIETINNHTADQQHLIALAYLLGEFCEFDALKTSHLFYVPLAQKVFGRDRMNTLLKRVRTLLTEWGYSAAVAHRHIPRTVCEVLLVNRSPRLEDVSIQVLTAVERNRAKKSIGRPTSSWLVALSRVLVQLRVICEPLRPIARVPLWRTAQPRLIKDVPLKWASICQFWFDTSTVCLNSRRRSYYFLLSIGRWVGHEHPEGASPAEWDRRLAAECVAMVTRMRSGEWSEGSVNVRNSGQPLAANTRATGISVVRRFFRDLQDWEMIPRHFDPHRAFATPKALIAQMGPNPRVLADDIWAKLLWAGINLAPDDLPRRAGRGSNVKPRGWFRFELVRALVITWLFAGLRVNEITRLQLGCVRWQEGDATVSETGEALPGGAVCFLEVPVNKTGRAFTKPVDRLVGEAISAWEKVRPVQSKLPDPKTGELVDFLFLDGMRRINLNYVNHSVIPMLCRKAGIPNSDVRGNISSHRARSTIASQLFNGKDPMTLFELQEWLGHSSPDSTQHYAKTTPTKLAKSYADAGYFGRNVRAIEVLIDQEVVKNGTAAQEPWKFYDLGHGLCTYDFFEQCPHRMACAKCSFYLPKDSSKTQILLAKENLLRLRENIPLGEAELAAVEDGLAAYGRLLEKLADTPTPGGPTPRELASGTLVQLQAASVPAASCRPVKPSPTLPHTSRRALEE